MPRGRDVRPTPEKVREALFNILGARFVEGARVLDLFAGTGALGIEALSRGAFEVVFVERSRRTATILRENVESLGLPGHRLLFREARAALRELAVEERPFDLILLDPPFALGLGRPVLETIVDLDLLSREGVIVLEHAASEPSPPAPGLIVSDERRYGTVKLAFYELQG